MFMNALKFGIKHSEDFIKAVSKKKNVKISELNSIIKNSKLTLPKEINLNATATNFDCTVINSTVGEKHIISLKNKHGKLIQRLSTDFGKKEVNKSTDYLTQILEKDGTILNIEQKSNNISSIPKHHRKQISQWSKNGTLENYIETDVILYRDKNNTIQGVKTTYQKDMPEIFSFTNSTDINETTTIEGLLGKKGLLYKRRSTFNTRSGEIINWNGYQRGLNQPDAKWIDEDIWLHCRVQSNSQQISQSVLYQKGINNAEINFVDLPSHKHGTYFMKKGSPNIEINQGLKPLQAFKTTIHEGNHLNDDKKIIEYLSQQLKGKTEKEIIEYTNSYNDELSYIYRKYLSGFYGDKNKIRKIAYERNSKINPTEVNQLVNANKTYVSASEDYNKYKTNFLEVRSITEETTAIRQRDFYTDDYKRIFTPDIENSNFTTFF